ncbi:MAG: branched-chain amino acid ABC transporter permease [Acidilobaceae archaeon]
MVELPIIFMELANMLVFIIVVLALNLMAGYAGIPNLGMALFVYIGAFAVAGLSVRFAIILVNILNPDFIEMMRVTPPYKYAVGESPIVDIILFKVTDPAVNRHLVPELNSIIGDSIPLSIMILTFILASAIGLGATLGLIVSFTAVRLREDYLAIVLLAFSEMLVQVFFAQVDWVAGGRYNTWALTPWPQKLSQSLGNLLPSGVKPELFIGLIVAIILAITTLIYTERIANSPMGRVLRAMRDDDLALTSYGRDIAKIRLKVMMVGSSIAALAGVIYVLSVQPVVKATDYTRATWTFIPWAMMILGGIANNWGVIIGAVIVYIGRKLIEILAPPAFTTILSLIGVEVTGTTIDIVKAVTVNILVGVIIILVLYLKPEGIVPEKPSKTLPRKTLNSLIEKFRGSSS